MKISKGRPLSILQKLFFLFLISVKWQNIRKNYSRFSVFIFSSVAYGVSAQEGKSENNHSSIKIINNDDSSNNDNNNNNDYNDDNNDNNYAEKENFGENISRNVLQLSSPKEVFENLIFTVCQGVYFISYFYPIIFI